MNIKQILANPIENELCLDEYCKNNRYDLQSHRILGTTKLKLNKFDEAKTIFERLIKLDNNQIDYTVLSGIYTRLNESDKVIDLLKKLINISPGYMPVKQLTDKLWLRGDYQEAFSLLSKYQKYYDKPDHWNNLADYALKMKDFNIAELAIRNAIRLDKNNSKSHLCLSDLFYYRNDWKYALKEQEHRLINFDEYKIYFKKYPLNKLWTGKEPLYDKTLLVYGEQGLGDNIQFSRFIDSIKAKNIIFNCPAPVAPLFCNTISINCALDERIPYYDYHIPLLSLPYVLNIDNISGKSYIQAKNELSARIKDYKKFKIGFSFEGNKQHKLNKFRSIPSDFFNFNDLNVQLFNLQYPCTHLDFDCINLTTNDLSDTADVISGLDLLISCDSAITHLGGAIGAKTFLCLPYFQDPRWGLNETTYWYDSIKIFRQKEINNWTSVFSEIREEISALVNNSSY